MEENQMNDNIMRINYNDSYVYYYYYPVNNSDFLYYDEDTRQNTFLTGIRKSTAILGGVLSVSSVIFNLLVITVCFRDRKQRSDIFYMQVANFSIAHVLIGGFVIPLTVYSILHPWNLGDTLCKIWIISDVYLPLVSLFILNLLNVDRLVLITHAKTYDCLFQLCLRHILLICPWIIAFVLVVPLWTHGSLPYELQPGECIVMLSKSVAFSGCFITYFVPCASLLFIALFIVLMRLRSSRSLIFWCDRKHSLDSKVVSEDVATEITSSSETNTTISQNVETASRQSIAAVFLASFLFCSMWFPYQCTNLLISLCTSEHCMPSPALSQVVTWAATATSCVVPIAWLVDKNNRLGCKLLFSCENKSLSDEPEEVTV